VAGVREALRLLPPLGSEDRPRRWQGLVVGASLHLLFGLVEFVPSITGYEPRVVEFLDSDRGEESEAHLSLVAGGDEAGLVGVDDGLDAIAEAELAEQVGDVGLDGGF
jgi:hypothetical protein